MATIGRDIETVELTEEQLWVDGPPYETFKEMRGKCPIHWTENFELFPEEAGFWSVTTADDVHTVSRDWQTYSSELGGVLVAAAGFPIELARAMFIGMDPPKHDLLKQASRPGASPPTRTPSGRSPSRCSTNSTAARAATWSATSRSRSSRV